MAGAVKLALFKYQIYCTKGAHVCACRYVYKYVIVLGVCQRGLAHTSVTAQTFTNLPEGMHMRVRAPTYAPVAACASVCL